MSVSTAASRPLALLPRPSLLSLYRSILRHARRFPSSKRAGIVRDIRAEFRAGAKLTGPPELLHQEQTRAVDGLKMLQKYVTLNSTNSSVWTLSL